MIAAWIFASALGFGESNDGQQPAMADDYSTAAQRAVQGIAPKTDVYEYTGWSLRKTTKQIIQKRNAGVVADAVDDYTAATERETNADQMKLYVYPPNFKEAGILSYFYSNVTAALTKSIRRTTNPAEADVFFLGIDTSCERNWPSYTTDPIEINYEIGDPEKCNVDKWKKAEEYLGKAEGILYGQEDGAPAFSGNGNHVVFDMTSWYTMPKKMREWKQPISYATPSSAFTENYIAGKDISWPAKNLVDFSNGE
jgi:hypothetical protein